MEIKSGVILTINNNDRITKSKLSSFYGINQSTIKYYVNWYNSFSKKKIKYDKDGYYFEEKLNEQEIKDFRTYTTSTLQLEFIFKVIYRSFFEEIKIRQKIKIHDEVYSLSTLNSKLSKYGLDKLEDILKYKNEEKIYVMSILPLYYSEHKEITNNDFFISFFENENIEINKLFEIIIKDLYLLFDTIDKKFFSTHSILCLETFYLISYLVSENEGYSYDDIFEYNIKYPSYLDYSTLQTILILETDLLPKTNELDSFESFFELYKKLSSVNFLNISKGYYTPILDKIVFSNPALYNYIKENCDNDSLSEYLKISLINKVISTWILNDSFTLAYKVDSKKDIDKNDFQKIYESFYFKECIYIKQSNITSAYKDESNIYIEFRNDEEFKKICRSIFYSQKRIVSFDEFYINLLKTVPISYYADYVSAFKINFPNGILNLLNFSEIQSYDSCDIYSMSILDNFKNVALFDKDGNIEFKQ